MWVSNYNIYISLPDNAHYLIVHGYTGAIDCVDADLARSLQECFAKRSDASILKLPIEIRDILERRGYLTELPLEEEVAFVAHLAQKIQARHSERTEFWFIPSYNCQLRCKYCFERPLQEQGEREGWLAQQMSPDLVDAAFAAITRLQVKRTVKRIVLYGGEPLMSANRQIVRYIVDRGVQLGYYFGALTNGVDLHLYEDLLGKGRIEQLLVTIDGARDTHNRLRVYRHGEGTFDQIIRNIQLALRKGVYILLRVNVTWDVLAHLYEFAQLVQELEWDRNPNLRIHCYAVHTNQQYRCGIAKSVEGDAGPCLADGGQGLSVLIDNAKVANFIYKTKLYDHLGGLWSADPYMAILVNTLFCGRPGTALSAAFCGAHYGFYIFDPFGNIYPCSRLVGNMHHRIGVFIPQLAFNENCRRWHERAVYNMPACLKCPFVLYCRGGCAQQALLEKGDIYHPYCDGFDERFRAAMATYYIYRRQFYSWTLD